MTQKNQKYLSHQLPWFCCISNFRITWDHVFIIQGLGFFKTKLHMLKCLSYQTKKREKKPTDMKKLSNMTHDRHQMQPYHIGLALG